MYFLGMMGIVQAAFLPGTLFVHLYRPKGGIIYKFSLVFASSLFINFILVHFLRLLSIYTRPTMLIIFTLEVAAVIFVNWKRPRRSLDQWGEQILKELNSALLNLKDIFIGRQFPPTIQLIRGISITGILVVALVLVYWFGKHFVTNIGTVINTWDALYSWNVWAVNWAENLPIKNLTYYPQLLPIKLSIPYVFTDNVQVNFFSKAIIPLFSVLIVLLIFEEGIQTKKFGYFIAVIITYLMVKKFLGEYITEPYADLPLAFMSLTTVLTYLHSDKVLNHSKDLFLVLILTAATAVTKQPGLILFPVLMVLTLLDGDRNKTSLRRFGWFALVAIIAAGIEYFPKIIPAIQNFDQTGLSTYFAITGNVHNVASLPDRMMAGFTSLGKYGVLLLLTIPASLLLQKKFKWIAFLLILPYSLLWAVLASYDARNLALIIPLVAVLAGLAAEKFVEWIFSFLSRKQLGRLPVWTAAVLALILIAAPGFWLTSEKITADWIEKQKQIFAPGINQQLYALDFSGSCQKILTNYPIDFLPGLEKHKVGFYYDSPEFYQQAIGDPALCWLLIPPYADGAIQSDVALNLENGTYQLLYTEDHWIEYRLISIH
jgi:hypothetical protein